MPHLLTSKLLHLLDADHVANEDRSSPAPTESVLEAQPDSRHEASESSCSLLDFEPEASPLLDTSENLKNDLAFFIDATKSVSEVEQVVRSMSDSQKYHLLKHHDKPSEKYLFPKQYLGGADRSFKLRWIEECGWWLVYSSQVDGAFCICCALFAHVKERKNMGAMVNAPFRKWHHKSEVITAHVSKPSHIAASQVADEFIHSIENPEKTISVMLDKKKPRILLKTGTYSSVLQRPYCIVVASALHSGETRSNGILQEILETFCH